MRLDLSQLESGRRLRKEFAISPQDAVLTGYQAQVQEPLRLDVELTRPSADTYVLTAELEGTVLERCRRCLIPVTVEVADRFRVVYQETGPEEFAPADDLVALAPGAREIEIGDEVRDRLFLETERYPVCRADCRGLCPHCGRNLNEGPCDCAEETSDTRWDALRSIRLGSGDGA